MLNIQSLVFITLVSINTCKINTNQINSQEQIIDTISIPFHNEVELKKKDVQKNILIFLTKHYPSAKINLIRSVEKYGVKGTEVELSNDTILIFNAGGYLLNKVSVTN